ncbi:MAG: aminodeoxychorismate synthase component I [Balneolaceae bacterium]|nr:aminodeoxychorismate synthase component I [Balneolaceae bacterium]
MRKLDQLIRHFEREAPVVLLESQSKDHPESQRSYLAANPIVTIKGFGNTITVVEDGEKLEYNSNPWAFLSDFVSEKKDWFFGYLGYDLKNNLENLNSLNDDPVGAPDFFLMIPGFLAEIDRNGEVRHIIKGKEPEKLKINDELGQIEISRLKSSVSKDEYIAHINEAQHRIKEGEFYEVNLSHQQQADFLGEPYQLYRKMCDVGPVPFGAYLSFEDISVCSLSPERFLKRENEHVFSQPIKGTIKRGATSDEDLRFKLQLQDSVKDRAENLMIVDLVRNDLSRIAKKNSVRVKDLFQIQTFGTIHQMVSTVLAQPAVDNPIEIIKACYPMGSMTGAPKISAMKAIEELENYKRGIYSGAIGYIKPNTEFDFNVVIRTAIIKGHRLFYSVGGAITGDSDPEEEWQETMVKARALTGIMH